jgi:hypothetical protein
MKKLLIGLLALGLVFSFSVPVMASDFSVSGSYRVRGWLDTNSPLYEDDAAKDAYYDQRLRVQPEFQVVEGLKVTCRFDALEKVWGNTAYTKAHGTAVFNDPAGELLPPGSYEIGSPIAISDYVPGSKASIEFYGNVPNTNESITFNKAYVTFMTNYGEVMAGINSTNLWGTDFGNTEEFVGEIDFKTKLSENLAVLFRVEKDVEADGLSDNTIEDQDKDAYIAAAVYKMEGMEGGLLWKYVRDVTTSIATQNVHVLSPYVKATVGPAYVEGQIYWATGDVEYDDFLGWKDDDLSELQIYLMAKADVGPGYVGAMFAYAEGDDDPADDDIKGILSGSDWNPCLILFNDTQPTTVGRYSGATTGTALDNAYLWQVFGGMSPMENLSLMASFTYAYADEKLDNVDDNYGSEIDITASYKIYDNLDYTVGFGYLFAGDYYKGDDKDNDIDDTYLLMNKLQVDF